MMQDSSESDTSEDIVARFNPLYRPYLLLSFGLGMMCTIIAIPAAIVWFCGLGQWWTRRFFNNLSCRLDARTLRFRKGILFHVEKTIPLENIQDVTFVEGPLLRKFHLATLKFETAGHSAGQASDMHLTGIIDAHEFRNRIMEARDALRQQHSGRGPSVTNVPSAPVNDASLAMLSRISLQLDEIAALLRERR